MSCCICLDTMDGKLIETVCKHQFHKDCLVRWMEQHAVCPLCRKDISFIKYITCRNAHQIVYNSDPLVVVSSICSMLHIAAIWLPNKFDYLATISYNIYLIFMIYFSYKYLQSTVL